MKKWNVYKDNKKEEKYFVGNEETINVLVHLANERLVLICYVKTRNNIRLLLKM